MLLIKTPKVEKITENPKTKNIVFAIMLLDVHLPHEETIITTILCTIFLSVVLHGITANPIASSFKTNASD